MAPTATDESRQRELVSDELAMAARNLGEKLQDLANTNRELGCRIHDVLIEYARLHRQTPSS